MPSFAELLSSKIAEKGLTAGQAAEAIGVSAVSLRGVTTGASVPNARSIGKYVAFVGISEEEAKTLLAASKADKPAKKPRGKPGRKAKGGKPGRKAKADKPARAGKAGRKAKGGAAAAALSTISEALAAADALSRDALAMQVHGLSAGQRRVVEAIVNTMR
jgi:hypothetical protein